MYYPSMIAVSIIKKDFSRLIIIFIFLSFVKTYLISFKYFLKLLSIKIIILLEYIALRVLFSS